jgi:hypothetical protein
LKEPGKQHIQNTSDKYHQSVLPTY